MFVVRLCGLAGGMAFGCGSLFLLQLGDGSVRGAHAQSREVLVGFSGRAAAARPDWPGQGHADRGADHVATRFLDDARGLIARGELLEGRRRLEILVARYPNAMASDQARRELARLYALPNAAEPAIGRRPGHGPGGIKPDGMRGTAVAVGLGAVEPAGDSAGSRDAWLDEPRLARVAEQDFRLSAGDRVFFRDRSVELGSRARVLLAAQAQWLKQVPRASVVVEGHADDQGSVIVNQELAARRAQAVRDRLVAEGIDPDRISIAVHGSRQPVALCADGECAAQNRRVVTVLRGTRAVQAIVAPRPGP